MHSCDRRTSISSTFVSHFILILALFSSVLVDGQRKRVEEELNELTSCAKNARDLIENPVPTNRDAVNQACRDWTEFVDCINKAASRTLEKQTRKRFEDSVKPAVQSVIQLCTNDTYKNGYLRYSKCVHDIVMDGCGERYHRLKDLSMGGEDDAQLCCQHYEFSMCVQQGTEEECSEEALEFVDTFVQKAFKTKCSNYIYNREDCQYGDDRKQHRVLDEDQRRDQDRGSADRRRPGSDRDRYADRYGNTDRDRDNRRPSDRDRDSRRPDNSDRQSSDRGPDDRDRYDRRPGDRSNVYARRPDNRGRIPDNRDRRPDDRIRRPDDRDRGPDDRDRRPDDRDRTPDDNDRNPDDRDRRPDDRDRRPDDRDRRPDDRDRDRRPDDLDGRPEEDGRNEDQLQNLNTNSLERDRQAEENKDQDNEDHGNGFSGNSLGGNEMNWDEGREARVEGGSKNEPWVVSNSIAETYTGHNRCHHVYPSLITVLMIFVGSRICL